MNFTPLWEEYQQKARAEAGMNGAGNSHDNVEPFPADILELSDPTTIPPREWLYGNILLKKYVTLLSAPGGVAKTSYTIGVGISVATGRPYLGEKVHVPGNVLFCSLEDPKEELDRRVAAFMLHHKIERDALRGKLIRIDGRANRLVIAKRDREDTIVYPDKARLIELIRRHGIRLVIPDPFANTHEVSENNNDEMNAAARAWAEVANDGDCSTLLPHHTKKRAVAGDADSSRGASAVNNACRKHLTAAPMSDDEAKNYGIPVKKRKTYVRIDTAKENMSPPDEHTVWLHLASVQLGNCTDAYPDGDNVQAVERWMPPDVMEGLTIEQCNEALDAIESGPEGDPLYTMNCTTASVDRWAGKPLMDLFGMEKKQAAKIIKTWKDNGVLVEEEFKNSQRKPRKGARVVAAKRPGTRPA